MKEIQKKMTEIQKKLVEENHNTIYDYIHRYLNHDIDTYYDILAIALCKAAISFDESKCIKFITYCYVVFDNEIRFTNRKKSAKIRRAEEYNISLDSSIKDEEDITLLDIVHSNYHLEDVTIILQLIRKILSSYSMRDRHIIVSILAGDIQNDIANRVGISQSMISRIYRRFQEELYQELYN